MAEYIEREAVLAKKFNLESRLHEPISIVLASEIEWLPAADVRPVVRGKNLGNDYNEVDQFVCSECGVELQEWVRVERDEDFGEVTYHEQRLNFCPICGADVREAKA